MKEYKLFDFERKEILEYAKTFENIEEQVKYLKYVRKEYKVNPPELDTNYGIRPGLVKVLTTEIEYLTDQIAGEKLNGSEELSSRNGLKSFKTNELQKNLKPFVNKLKLEKYVSVTSRKVQLITRQLISEGWDAKESSVAETLRKMGYVEGRRK